MASSVRQERMRQLLLWLLKPTEPGGVQERPYGTAPRMMEATSGRCQQSHEKTTVRCVSNFDPAMWARVKKWPEGVCTPAACPDVHVGCD
eukprot:12423030-Karenia_brevis.AAC.1